MPRDPLLSQLREPWWRRIDRRLAAVLAVSIGGHLAVAIAAWVGDPPVARAWLDPPEYATYAIDTVETVLLPPPPIEPDPVPGAATPAPAPSPVPAIARRIRGGGDPGRLRTPPRPIDAQALISDLVGDGLAHRGAARRAPGKELAAQIADAEARRAAARIGVDGGPAPLAIGEGAGPDTGELGGPARTQKLPEAPPPRVEGIGNPRDDVDYDPSAQINAQVRAIQRCYQTELAKGDPDLRGRVRLAFTLAPDGHVLAAHAGGLAGVAECVERRARSWTFPVKLPHAADFEVTLVFSPR